jgi:hypothetical protein
METITRTIGDLAQAERSALERMVGHSLDTHQQIVIQIRGINGQPVANPETIPPLPTWCNIYDGMSEEEIEAADRAIVRSHTSRTFDLS